MDVHSIVNIFPSTFEHPSSTCSSTINIIHQLKNLHLYQGDLLTMSQLTPEASPGMIIQGDATLHPC